LFIVYSISPSTSFVSILMVSMTSSILLHIYILSKHTFFKVYSSFIKTLVSWCFANIFHKNLKSWLSLTYFAVHNYNERWEIGLNIVYCNPSLGLATKARVCKRWGQEKDPGVWESVRMNSHSQMNFHVGSWSPGGLPKF
jgi:hypothetical protein